MHKPKAANVRYVEENGVWRQIVVSWSFNELVLSIYRNVRFRLGYYDICIWTEPRGLNNIAERQPAWELHYFYCISRRSRIFMNSDCILVKRRGPDSYTIVSTMRRVGYGLCSLFGPLYKKHTLLGTLRRTAINSGFFLFWDLKPKNSSIKFYIQKFRLPSENSRNFGHSSANFLSTTLLGRMCKVYIISYHISIGNCAVEQ